MSAYDQFRAELLDTQNKANKSNAGLNVLFRGQTTFVEPNLPKFTKKEIDRRYTMIMNAQAEADSLSILAPSGPSKLSKKGGTQLILLIYAKNM